VADVIRLEGIEVFAHHGVFSSERRDGQTFVIDVEVEYDMGPAAASDDVADAIDYGALAERHFCRCGPESGEPSGNTLPATDSGGARFFFSPRRHRYHS